MAIRVHNIVLGVDEPESLLLHKVAEILGLPTEAVVHWQIARRSLDARRRRVRFVYTVDLALADSAQETAAVGRGPAVQVETPQPLALAPGKEEVRGRVVVVGCGPAGQFAALKLAEYGYCPLLLERGAPIEERHRDVARFFSERRLDADSNLLFGAGGAGTYSDGKLRTRIRDPRIREVLDALVAAGASPDIRVDARPHLGTDRLHDIVANLCSELVGRGGEISWRTKLGRLVVEEGRLRCVTTSKGTIETNCLVLATGGNAQDTFEALLDSGLKMEPKPFQMGLRVEHPREMIDRAVYGSLAGHPRLGAADYVLSVRSVTSFCVCPGGVLVAACAEPETVCTNGMSNYARDGEFTNAALVTTVHADEFGSAPLAGLEFQRRWEREAFRIAGGDYAAPGQNVTDFLAGRVRPLTRSVTYPLGVRPAALEKVLPRSVHAAIAEALPEFERRIPGFAGSAGIMVGPETRVSCPVRIVRDPEKRVSISADGVYPAGEGSGYASGILSSAVDGIRAAEAVIMRFAISHC